MAVVMTEKRTLGQRLGFSKGNKSSGQRGKLSKRNPAEINGNGFQQQQAIPSVPSVQEQMLQRRSLPWDEGYQEPFSEDPKLRAFSAPATEMELAVQTMMDLHKDVIDKDTGERKDLTEMLHALHYDESQDYRDEYETEDPNYVDPTRPRGEPMLTKLSAEMWVSITDFLLPREAANLALTCKTALWLLGSKPFEGLRLPENKQERVEFLLPMDIKLPGQLFCVPCAAYHIRTQPGFESLKPPGVLNPVFVCPNRTNNSLPPPRVRITAGRQLPFTFVQLVTRAKRFGPIYGVTAESMSRRWKDPWSDWQHQTRFHVAKNGHLLMRVVSQVWAEGGLTIAAKRMLLYSRDDYSPYFSVCAHWRDGMLMDNCKCALDHIPKPKPRTAYLGGDKMPGPKIVTMCPNCQPMRRCPQCPSEYLLELKLVEDKEVKRNSPLRFKQALVVTRWCDLGNGINPQGREWTAILGEYDGYDSIEETGNRAVSSTFESAFTDSYPFQRLLSLNPNNVRKGEEGNSWY